MLFVQGGLKDERRHFYTRYREKRPGIYFNFKTTAEQRITLGERGTVALPLVMSWEN